MKRFRLILILFLVGLTPATAIHAYTIFTDEAAFKQALTGSFQESFENEAVWGAVRSAGTTINAAATVSHQGITWRSPDGISTSLGAGREGYGIFAYEHQTPDRLGGESSELLVAIGFWARSNTPPAKLHLILDDSQRVDFDDLTLGTTPIFYGVIAPDGFTRFEMVEQEGTVGDQKRFSADDFTFAANAEVTPSPTPPPAPPAADAGPNRVVTEGDSLTLAGSASGGEDIAIVGYAWEQLAGPPAPLSQTDAAETHFVAPPLDGADADLRFRLTVTDANGGQAQDEVLVMVVENGIDGYPPGAYTFFGAGGDPMGLSLGDGVALVHLQTVDPVDLPDADAQQAPDQIPYGLFDFTLKVAAPGDSAVVDFWLPERPEPAAGWFKYGAQGWRSLGPQAVFVSDAEGDRVTLSVSDGGPFDADGRVDGFIVDPSGLAWYNGAAPEPAPNPTPSPSETDDDGTPGPPVDDGGGGGGGCFVADLGR